MTRLLILGGGGMLGHKLCQVLGSHFETYATFRAKPLLQSGAFDHVRTFAGVDAKSFVAIEAAVRRSAPDLVINAIGVIKQRREANVPSASIEVNSLLPHRLEELCRTRGALLLHISTDCVFSGSRGNYTEADLPDPVDLYGRTKLVGEVVDSPAALTIRTSLIGRELDTRHGLVEWFLENAGGRVKGYARAIFSGLTTTALAEIIRELVNPATTLRGLWHVSSQPISKYALLLSLNSAFGTNTTVDRDESITYDRSLDSARFWATTGLRQPDWSSMVQELSSEKAYYDNLSRKVAVRSDA